MPMILNSSEPAPGNGPRPLSRALIAGWHQKCPACGRGELYSSFLKVRPQCPECGTELHHQRADDAPPYFTMVIVAHVVVGGILWMEKAFAPPTWVHLAIWLPLTLLLSLWLLPRVKGMLVGMQWALRMHGFASGGVSGEGVDAAAPIPMPAVPRSPSAHV